MYVFFYFSVAGSLSLLSYGITFPAETAYHKNINHNTPVMKARWCVASLAEHKKCADLATAIEASHSRDVDVLKNVLNCVSKHGKEECAVAIENSDADITSLESGELFFAGNWHGLIPIAVEEYGGNSNKDAVVVIRRDTISSLSDLRNKSLCSPGVATLAGWIIPLSRLISSDFRSTGADFAVKDCNNVMKSAAQFFGPSCVPGIFSQWHSRKRNDNPVSLCQRCDNQCSMDNFYGNDGALNCLVQGGDAAFVSADVALKLPPPAAATFQFLCLNGQTAPLTTATMCSWGSFPGNVFVISSSKSSAERTLLQQFIFNLTKLAPQVHSDRYAQSGERRYNGTDLMWSDSLTRARLLSPPEQNIRHFLGQDLFELAAGDKVCPFLRMRLCVIGLEELGKCESLQTALSSVSIKPAVVCILARNHWDCMQRISAGYADVMVADAADAYLAGTLYGLVPFMHETYDNPEPFLYAVAVAKRTDLTTTLLDLRGKSTCHGQIYGAVGWSYPVHFLITQHRVRPAYDCQDLSYQISQIFQKACAPGALVTAHYRGAMHLDNLCDLCMGDGESYCARNPMEPYFGPNGAFKCLAEGGGHVAFVPHRTPRENTDGRNMRTWSRALVSQDYQLLCPDGTRASIFDYKKCNIGKVPATVLLTSRARRIEEVDAYVLLFDYAQKYFGFTSSADFGLFESDGALNQDLIFSDATTRLLPISMENRTIENYLGEDFIRLIKGAQCAGGIRLHLESYNALKLLTVAILVTFLGLN